MRNTHLFGHTGKRIIWSKDEAIKLAKHGHHGKRMRYYQCSESTGRIHWHLTSMSKGRFYANQRYDTRRKLDY